MKTEKDDQGLLQDAKILLNSVANINMPFFNELNCTDTIKEALLFLYCAEIMLHNYPFPCGLGDIKVETNIYNGRPFIPQLPFVVSEFLIYFANKRVNFHSC